MISLMPIAVQLLPFVCIAVAGEPAAPAASQPTSQPAAFDLTIFKASRMWQVIAGQPLDYAQLQDLATMVTKEPAGDKAMRDGRYPLVPVLLAQSTELFEARSLSKEQVAKARELVTFFGRVFPEIGLDTRGRDADTLRAELDRIRAWFLARTKDYRQCAEMIFTTDDGPFFPPEMPRLPTTARVVAEQPMPGTDAYVVIYEEPGAREPVLIGVRRGKEEVVSLVRLSGGKMGTVRAAEFVAADRSVDRIRPLGPYGFKVGFFATWNYGHEYTHLYVDTDLHIRYYFLSW